MYSLHKKNFKVNPDNKCHEWLIKPNKKFHLFQTFVIKHYRTSTNMFLSKHWMTSNTSDEMILNSSLYFSVSWCSHAFWIWSVSERVRCRVSSSQAGLRVDGDGSDRVEGRLALGLSLNQWILGLRLHGTLVCLSHLLQQEHIIISPLSVLTGAQRRLAQDLLDGLQIRLLSLKDREERDVGFCCETLLELPTVEVKLLCLY